MAPLRGPCSCAATTSPRSASSGAGSVLRTAAPAGGRIGRTDRRRLPPTSLAPASAATSTRHPAGHWTIADGSVVGYRVRERLASLSADSDAVGRTNGITGSATIAASGGALSVTDADVHGRHDVPRERPPDARQPPPQRRHRDRQLPDLDLQAHDQPVALPAAAASGTQFDVTLHGDLTLHGVTKTVDIPAKAQLNGSQIQVVGTLSFPFSDYEINAPNIGGFVAVQDHGTLEFQVNLAKA